MGAWSVGALARAFFSIDTLVNTSYVGKIEFHLRAVASSQRSVAFEGVGNFALKGPFAGHHLSGVRVVVGQIVGVLHGEWGKIVDVASRGRLRIAPRAEGHILAALSLKQKAHAAFRIGS